MARVMGGGRWVSVSVSVLCCVVLVRLELLLRLSRASKNKQAVENAVLAIAILTRTTRALELTSDMTASRDGPCWHRPQPPQPQSRPGSTDDACTYAGRGGGSSSSRTGASVRSDVSEAPSVQSVAERYLNLTDEDLQCRRPSLSQLLSSPHHEDLPYAGLATPTPPPPSVGVPTMQQARRELRAKLLRDRAGIAAKATVTAAAAKRPAHAASTT